jgi:hypothetical protein
MMVLQAKHDNQELLCSPLWRYNVIKVKLKIFLEYSNGTKIYKACILFLKLSLNSRYYIFSPYSRPKYILDGGHSVSAALI